MEAMYRRARVNVKVEPRSTFTSTRDFRSLLPVYFYVYARKKYVTVLNMYQRESSILGTYQSLYPRLYRKSVQNYKLEVVCFIA